MKYISILRGINVSGQKIIKMTELKSLYILLGFRNIVTYIQSGNVIFETSHQNEADIKYKIEEAIEQKFNFKVPVLIRTNSEIRRIIKNCPFKNVNFTENGTKLAVTFLSSIPSKESVLEIQKYAIAPEKLVVIGREIYLYYPNGFGKTKLTNILFEKKLSLKASTRNWKSVLKLYELSV